MPTKKVIFVPTLREAEGIFGTLDYIQSPYGYYESNFQDKKVVITGITKTCAALATFAVLSSQHFDEAYLLGIAGAYRESGLEIGELVSVKFDFFVDEALFLNNKITFLSEIGFPFCKKNNVCFKTLDKIKIVNSNTVSLLSSDDHLAKLYFHKTQAYIENMEGAAFGFVAQKFGIDFFQIRGISNYCGKRDNQMWEVKKAFNSLKNLSIEI